MCTTVDVRLLGTRTRQLAQQGRCHDSGQHPDDIDNIANERAIPSTYIHLTLRHVSAFEIAYSADGNINVRRYAGHKIERDGHHTSR